MNFDLAKDIISSYEKISIIEGQNNNQTILFKIFDKKFAMLLPEKYDNSRAQVFIIDEPDFSYPHIMLNNVNYSGDDVLPCGIYRSVCLWEESSIVQSIQTFEEKISDTIERLLELLLLPCKKIEFEFQKEFMYYWNSSAIEKQKIFLYLDSSSINSQLEVYHNSGTNEYRYVSKAYFLNDLNKIEKGKRVWNNRADIYAFYLKIIDSRGILPPRRGHDWEISDIENIIAGNQIRHINREAFLKLKEDCFSYNIIDLIFEMDINSIPVTFVSRIQCTSGKNSIIYKILNNSNSVIPLKSTRMDNEYLNIIIGNNNKNCKKMC